MTPQEQEQEIREREQAATVGPWERSDEPDGGHRVCQIEAGVCVCCLGLMGNYDYENTRWSTATVETWRADAEFVAHARDDIPYLLARVAQLEAALHEVADYNPPIKNLDDWHVSVALYATRVAREALTTMPALAETEG
jgi:hypothetical protein